MYVCKYVCDKIIKSDLNFVHIIYIIVISDVFRILSIKEWISVDKNEIFLHIDQINLKLITFTILYIYIYEEVPFQKLNSTVNNYYISNQISTDIIERTERLQ